ncbi:MAG: MotA/TolQ/ExbB proton channel family protein [Planctomycetota bacterium]
MRKSFLLRLFFLSLVIVVVAAMAVFLRNSFAGVQSGQQSQSFFEQFVLAGGPVVWFVLLPMSLIAVYLAVEHSLTIRRSRLVPVGIGSRIAEMIQNNGSQRLALHVADKDDFISTALAKALNENKGDWLRMRSAIAESLQDQAATLLRRIEWVNLIGNVSPMVGLFGTVFGMIKLFNAIVTAGGQPQPAHLAEGISIALVTTFWGLFIAIPALAIHGIFRNRIETLANDAVTETEVFLSLLQRPSRDKISPAVKTKLSIHEIGGNSKKSASDLVRGS